MDIYSKDIFITFDIDWAANEILEYTLDIIEQADICATFFVTHDTPILKRMRSNPKIELGIHPNFNSLLNLDGQTAKELLKEIKEIVPEATSVRSHSLFSSSSILLLYEQFGMTRDVNLFLPIHSDIVVKPFKHVNGILRIPFVWEDDVHCVDIVNGYENGWHSDKILIRKGLKVFNFHPIHVFLNTEHLSRYEKFKQCSDIYNDWYSYINLDMAGTKTFLLNLINSVNHSQRNFKCIRDINV